MKLFGTSKDSIRSVIGFAIYLFQIPNIEQLNEHHKAGIQENREALKQKEKRQDVNPAHSFVHVVWLTCVTAEKSISVKDTFAAKTSRAVSSIEFLV